MNIAGPSETNKQLPKSLPAAWIFKEHKRACPFSWFMAGKWNEILSHVWLWISQLYVGFCSPFMCLFGSCFKNHFNSFVFVLSVWHLYKFFQAIVTHANQTDSILVFLGGRGAYGKIHYDTTLDWVKVLHFILFSAPRCCQLPCAFVFIQHLTEVTMHGLALIPEFSTDWFLWDSVFRNANVIQSVP